MANPTWGLGNVVAVDYEIDEAMADSEAALRALAAEYPAYAAADVDRMEACLTALEAAAGHDSGLIRALHDTAHDVKGQGAAFGYDLMTLLGEEICTLSRSASCLDRDALSHVRALVGACRIVLTERLLGSGGALGARLACNLGLAMERAPVP